MTRSVAGETGRDRHASIDAELIARYAQTVRPPVRPIPDEVSALQRTGGFGAGQLVETRATEQARKHLAKGSRSQRASIESRLRICPHRLTELDDELRTLVESHPAWHKHDEILLRKAMRRRRCRQATMIALLPGLGR